MQSDQTFCRLSSDRLRLRSWIPGHFLKNGSISIVCLAHFLSYMPQSNLEIRYLAFVLLHIVGPLVFDLCLFFLVLALGQFNLVQLRLHRMHTVLLCLELACYSLIIPPERRHLLLNCLEFQLLHVYRLSLQLDHFSVCACQFLKVDQSAPDSSIRLLDLLADLL